MIGKYPNEKKKIRKNPGNSPVNKKKYQLSRCLLINILTVAFSSAVAVVLLEWILVSIGNVEAPEITGINIIDRFDEAADKSMEISFGGQAERRDSLPSATIALLHQSQTRSVMASRMSPTCYNGCWRMLRNFLTD